MTRPGEASVLLALIVLWPMLAAGIAALWQATVRKGFNLLVVAATAVTLVGVAALVPAVLAESRVVASLPGLLGSVEFAADRFSLLFALAASLVWFCASLYATAYMRDDPGGARFQAISLVLLSTTLGVFLAGDFLTLFVFFEALGLTGLLFVLHEGSARARRAAVKYFWMTFVGGVALLAGILLLAGQTGSSAMTPLTQAADPALVGLALLLMLVGFGVKAGMLPLHVWLPDAHSVAPTPASAVLSGVMIKAGAYGVFRCLGLLSAPDATAGFGQALAALQQQAGMLVAWLGIAGMLVGVVFALGQHQAKRMLAWHSVSQMGFVLTGLGVGAWLGAEGALGTGGGLMHVVNHALFKACLFLGVGAVMVAAGTGDMYRLGGLWRRMPVTLGLMLVAAAGIAGVPLFNGFVSKCMIHHALVEAAGQPGGESFVLAEWLYFAACVGTAASFIKLIGLVFLSHPREQSSVPVHEAPKAMLWAMLLLAVPIVLLGVRPDLLIEPLMIGGVVGAAQDAATLNHYLDAYFLSPADLRSSLLMLLGGLALFVAGMRLGLFHLRIPQRIGVDYWYRAAGRALLTGCRYLSKTAAVGRGVVTRRFLAMVAAGQRMLALTRADRPRLQAWGASARLPEDALYAHLDRQRDAVIREAGQRARALAGYSLSTHECLQDRARHYAGWLGTRLIHGGLRMEHGPAMQLAASADCRLQLAELAVQLAEAETRHGEPQSGAGESVVARADRLLESLLDLPAEKREPVNRKGWRELRSILIHLATDPGVRHWPASENLAQGAFATQLRRAASRLAHDPGFGLALAGVVMIVLFLAMLYGSRGM